MCLVFSVLSCGCVTLPGQICDTGFKLPPLISDNISRLQHLLVFRNSLCWCWAGLEVAGTGLALGVFVTSQSVNLAGAIKLKFKTTHDTGSNERSTGSVVTLNKISHLATQHSLHTSLPAVCVCGSLGSVLHISYDPRACAGVQSSDAQGGIL